MWNGKAGAKHEELTAAALAGEAADTIARMVANKRHYKAEWTGRHEESTRRELVPNLANPHLMDTADVHTVALVYRVQDKPRGRWRNVQYHAFSRVERLEVGGYYDQR